MTATRPQILKRLLAAALLASTFGSTGCDQADVQALAQATGALGQLATTLGSSAGGQLAALGQGAANAAGSTSNQGSRGAPPRSGAPAVQAPAAGVTGSAASGFGQTSALPGGNQLTGQARRSAGASSRGPSGGLPRGA